MLSFEEILKPFTEEEAIAEAKRCLKCKNPLCVNGCPIKNKIPQFINEIANQDYKKAKEILDETTNMSSICSRVCDHLEQCVGHCILNKKDNPIDVGRLERFVADYDYFNNKNKVMKNKKASKVAIIGAGPAGIACAKQLALNDVQPAIYEKEDGIGGQLYYGIPEYRLKLEVLKREEEELERLGVKVFYNTKIGEDITINELLEDYEYVLLSTGASEIKNLRLEGRDLDGVYQASNYLKEVAKYQAGKIDKKDLFVKEGDTVLVIGGGNVAIDASRTAKRFTDKVKIVYRRWREVMPASDFEYDESIRDGIEYMWRRTPVEFIGENGKLKSFKVLNTNDENNHFEEIIECDKVFIAIGSNLDNDVFKDFDEVKLNDKWFVETEDMRIVGNSKVFVAGDVTLSPSTVVEAVKTGIECANKITEEVNGNVDSININNIDGNNILSAMSKVMDISEL